MLKQRVITAVVMLAVLLPVILFAPPGGFGALIGFVLIFAAWEWARLLGLRARQPVAYAALAGVVLALSVAMLPVGAPGLITAASLFWLLVAPYALLRKPALAQGAWRGFLLAAGLLLFAACWHALMRARVIGVPFVVSLMALVWLADIGAYFAGKAFGRRKLAPSISPGKTWEGAFGGLAVVLAVALVVAFVSQGRVATIFDALIWRDGPVRGVGSLVLLVALSIVGDLFESLMKRQTGVKDSSALLPGHGGVLDRVDALLPVLPLAMLIL
jgi:phosphatidate cytidylyltransferase